MKTMHLSFVLSAFIFSTGEVQICLADELHEKPIIQLGVSTSSIPSFVWIYKVGPTLFPPAVISNAIKIAQFKENERKSPNHRPEGDYFESDDGKRSLLIVPKLGWMKYRNDSASNGTKDVPDEARTLNIALETIRRLGVDSSQLARKDGLNELRYFREIAKHGWRDKVSGEAIEEVTSRGVDFVRSVDGIDFSGIGPLGGACVTVGSEGKILGYEVVWKGLTPVQLESTLTPREILDRLGKNEGKWSPNPLSSPSPKEIKVTRVWLVYKGIPGDEEAELIKPFARIEARLDYGFTNQISNFECEVLKSKFR